MPKIYLRLINGIRPSLPIESAGSPVEFQQPSVYGNFPIDLKLSPTGDMLESTYSAELHSKLATVLSKKASEDLTEEVLQAIRELFVPLHAAHQRILSLITIPSPKWV